MRVLLRAFWHSSQSVTLKHFSTSNSCFGVDKALLSKLRKQTGIPFINCKKALEKFDNNFDEAKTWLVEEAQRAGWARATKLQSRPMSQGLVAVVTQPGNVTMIEVNCETDFVAKNEKFITMVEKLADECSAFFENQSDNMIFASKDELGKIDSSETGTLADFVATNVGNLGENMALRRGAFLRADDISSLSSYVHPSAPGQAQKRLQMGKYGAVVNLTSSEGNAKPAVSNELGSHLCQHIVGMNPKTVGALTEAESSGSETNNEDEDALLQQDFLLDNSMKVGNLVKSNGIKVNSFVRFACGEELSNSD